MNKDSFVIYRSFYEPVKDSLSDEERGKLYTAICEYSFFGVEPDPAKLPPLVNMALQFILPTINRDQEKYQKICERNRSNGAKRWENEATGEIGNPKNASGKIGKISHSDTDTENDTENDNETESDAESEVKNPPSLSEDDIEIFNKAYNWIENNAPRVNQMKEPLTPRGLKTLRAMKDYTPELFKDVVESMHNEAGLLQKNQSAYHTIKKWMKMRIQKGGAESNVAATTTVAVEYKNALVRHKVAERLAVEGISPDDPGYRIRKLELEHEEQAKLRINLPDAKVLAEKYRSGRGYDRSNPNDFV